MDTHTEKALTSKRCQQETVIVEILTLTNGAMITRYTDGRWWTPPVASSAQGESLPPGDYDVLHVKRQLCVASIIIQ